MGDKRSDVGPVWAEWWYRVGRVVVSCGRVQPMEDWWLSPPSLWVVSPRRLRWWAASGPRSEERNILPPVDRALRD